MTSIIGMVYCSDTMIMWEVHTDGTAYSSANDYPFCAYRWPDGTWRPRLTGRKNILPVSASEDMEALFSNYIAGIIVGPVDPQRHLK